ncbi:hypothetical protein KIN20_018701 [Parelaphostrongylus tenuis]|uniref:7TM GPCR serpentine receptor class x (Srx) domain-containing protein n=1 Tax=Parelaphostrongylus tenuis TaxID=148309 RepID=A0AAD5MJU0_PARTN|nr:hypothetical protein KIN20_018701 [Parelaphostrongylus tenuis]
MEFTCEAVENYPQQMTTRRKAHVNNYYASFNKKNSRFLVQTVCTTLLFISTIICFHAIAPLFTTRFARFCTTTLTWGMNHVGAGVIIIMFNRNIRRNIFRPFRPQVSSSSAFLIHRQAKT